MGPPAPDASASPTQHGRSQRQPLRQDELREHATILDAQVARLQLELERCHNLFDACSVSEGEGRGGGKSHSGRQRTHRAMGLWRAGKR